ncbi:hypothetical protein [Pseudosporangium ferrugineum]|uniref:hypothetical protein n=1 Tax=Pseudosporangium ferrugineum TaxID=439699 RepID=UPI0013048B9D|nr:hypothetical protein [Pseudosporangium ferrugineum]
MELQRLGAWVLDELPAMNRAVLGDQVPPDLLTRVLRTEVLPGLPAPERLDPAEARRQVVHLGLTGASVARHFQERTPGGKSEPERAFDGLVVGAEQLPFRAYFAALADRTGTGHCHRESYASLVRWNVGTVEVRLDDRPLAVLPGVFDDGRVRSYTGTGGEERFFVLVKSSEAVELAVNDLLEPLGEDGVRLDSPDAVARLRLATALLRALRGLFVEFASRPAELSMPAEHFMDVFRQFAVHWTPTDIPPSGALDPEALKRDFLLGIGIENYDQHVRRLFPALLTDERAALERLMARPALPVRLLSELRVEPDRLAGADVVDLHRLVRDHPALLDWYRLLTAHAQAAGSHLMLSKKFLFKPQSRRDLAGVGDKPLVSNRAGTTGMTETFLERLTRARREHPLAALRRVVTGETADNGTPEAVPSPTGAASVAVALVA